MQALRQGIECDIDAASSDGRGRLGIGVSPAALRAECVGVEDLRRRVAAWKELCGRALEPNVFLDPSFALPLFRHASPGDKPRFLLLWDDEPTAFGRLAGLFPLALPRRRHGTSSVPMHDQITSGTPLVDRARAAAVIEAALKWLGSGRAPRTAAALAISSVPRDGAFASELRLVCAASLRRVVVLEERSRAVLERSEDDDGRVTACVSAKRRQQYARQVRRLARAGQRTFNSARTGSDVAAATERFLALEQQGWKTRTALLADPGLASFAREMTRKMADNGQCRIDSIEIDGLPVAMMIVLTDGDRAYLWKTAFDERYALFSPGVQLTLDVTRRQLADPSVNVTDSCAAPDHPVLGRLWPDRIIMADLFVEIAPGGARAFDVCLLGERARRAVRQAAKEWWLAGCQATRRLKMICADPIFTRRQGRKAGSTRSDGAGAAADRQMVVVRAGGEEPHPSGQAC